MNNTNIVNICIDLFQKSVDINETEGLYFKIKRLKKKDVKKLLSLTYKGWRLKRDDRCEDGSLVIYPSRLI